MDPMFHPYTQKLPSLNQPLTLKAEPETQRQTVGLGAGFRTVFFCLTAQEFVDYRCQAIRALMLGPIPSCCLCTKGVRV